MKKQLSHNVLLARLSLIGIILLTSFILSNTEIATQSLIAMGLLVMIISIGSFKVFYEWFKPLAIVLVIIITIQTFTFSQTLFDGFMYGAFSAIRVVNITTVFFLFTQVFTLHTIGKALSFLPYPFSFLLTLSIGLITPIREDYKHIRIAQLSRGWNPTWNPRSYIPLLTPMIARVLEKSQQLSIAIQSRGYTV